MFSTSRLYSFVGHPRYTGYFRQIENYEDFISITSRLDSTLTYMVLFTYIMIFLNHNLFLNICSLAFPSAIRHGIPKLIRKHNFILIKNTLVNLIRTSSFPKNSIDFFVWIVCEDFLILSSLFSFSTRTY